MHLEQGYGLDKNFCATIVLSVGGPDEQVDRSNFSFHLTRQFLSKAGLRQVGQRWIISFDSKGKS